LHEGQLLKLGLAPKDTQDEEEKQEKMKIVLKEFRIETDFEKEETTKFYLKESKRIRDKPVGSSKKAEQSSDEDEEDTIDEAFLAKQANSKDD
jgi:hypothetical protein